MQFPTPLRYPGGKGRLSRYIAEIIEMNGLSGGHYVETYAGGAGVAISLLYSEYVHEIHLNDINSSIFAFWDSVLNSSDELCGFIEDTQITMEEWHRQKEVQNQIGQVSNLELGFSTFFLNRTNRSGIICGGVIGGKEQKGEWKLDARYNKENLIQRIQKIAAYKARITITNLDAGEYVKTILPTLPDKTLIYLDPPYYTKGRGLYEDHYMHQDHADIAKLVQNEISQKWIVSYDNDPNIREFYKGSRQESFALHYSANKRFAGAELMVFCDELKTPNEIVPSRSAA